VLKALEAGKGAEAGRLIRNLMKSVLDRIEATPPRRNTRTAATSGQSLPRRHA
jgi:hypothetical protein